MDIKDFILIGGGILIAMVVGHGFWLAWKAKREPLRLDIVPDLIPDDVDEMERLRGELPNGGARVRHRRAHAGEPENLELDLLVGEAESASPQPNRQEAPRAEPQLQTEPVPERTTRARQAPPRRPAETQDDLLTTAEATEQHAKPTVREVSLVTEPRKTPANDEQPAKTPTRKATQPRGRAAPTEPPATQELAPVEELLIINILAPRGKRFEGEGLVTALRAQGLRYGEMNIFHRVDPATKAKLFSVANAVEPGTFDLADLNALQSPGMTFFLQLPGPDDALGVFNEMLEAARNVALELGGELRDEDLSVMTGQTTEHMRQRIADFARRRLSKRA